MAKQFNSSYNSVSLLLYLMPAALVYWVWSKHKRPQAGELVDRPPIVSIPDAVLFSNPREAYEGALKYGQVVGIRRKGRLEYIVDGHLAKEVLTNDAIFSFERGIMRTLNLTPLLLFPRSFLAGVEKFVHESMALNVELLVSRLEPIFQEKIARATAPVYSAGHSSVSIDLFHFTHTMMAESMTALIFGETYVTLKRVAVVEKLAMDMASVTGIYQNTSWWARRFPRLWTIVTWIRVVGYTIPVDFVFGMAWSIFLELNKHDGEVHFAKESLLYTWANSYRDKHTHKISASDRVWLLTLLIGLIFASIHQTAVVVVWTLYELAKRPEYLDALRSEYITETNEEGRAVLTHGSLRNAEHLDSFIREVMRKKGDTLSTIRQTTMDAPLGRYVIPKGSFVIPLATMAHESEEIHGEDAQQFVGDRWVGRDKPAVKVDPGYWPFGMGRWACPGRAIAIAEIKLIVLIVIMRSNPVLKGDSYTIVDPMNVTAVPPQGQFILTRRKEV